jgi:hypothetical protein
MARTKPTPRVSLRFVDDLIARHLELSRQLEELQAEKSQLDEQLRIALDLSPGKRAETPSGTAMLVTSDVVTYDLDALRERVSGELFETLTTRIVDKAHVEAAVSLGLLKPEVADAARRQAKRKPQLRVTRG